MTTYPINNNYKICRRCKLKKPIFEFTAERVTHFLLSGKKKYYYYRECNKCKKQRFKLLAGSKYKDRKNVYTKQGSLRWNGVLKNLKDRAKEKNINFIISKKDFTYWVNNQPDTCTYCGLTIELSKKVLSKIMKKGSVFESKRFQIDRKNNSKSIGYTIDNICFACSICNSHKMDFYSHKEFKDIAERYIRPIVNRILRG